MNLVISVTQVKKIFVPEEKSQYNVVAYLEPSRTFMMKLICEHD